MTSPQIKVRLLQDFDCIIVGIEGKDYYLGKSGEQIKLPLPNASTLVDRGVAQFI